MADKKEKSLNGRFKRADDNILSDSDSSSADLECDICGISFPNMKSYEGHLNGKKHQKKVTESKFLAKHLADSKEDSDESDEEEDSSKIHCEVCDIYVSGYKSFSTHLKGSSHTKNVKKQKLKEKFGDMPEVLDNENKGNGSDDDELFGRVYARCSACQKEFSGPEPFNHHIKSAAHKKKVKLTQAMHDLKSLDVDEANNSDDAEFSKCDVCQKSFSGFVPYQIHMKSNAHAKRVEKQKVAEEMKEHFVNDEASPGYVCKECKKTFTDPVAFKSHLTHNSHEKLKAKNALEEFLSSHPEIVFVTPFDKQDSEKSDADDSDSDYYLICKICHMSFSGPESAQDHVKSKKHISMKREKKLRKLIKEQKAKSTVESNNKPKEASNNKSSSDKISENSKVEIPEKTANLDDFEMI